MSVTPESSPRRWIRSVAGAVVALMASSIAAVALGVGVAGADTAPVDPTEPETVAADSLPTVQIDGVVWDQLVVGNTVYATGSFTSARPAGSVNGSLDLVDAALVQIETLGRRAQTLADRRLRLRRRAERRPRLREI